MESPDYDNWTPLHQAAFNGRAKVVEVRARFESVSLNSRFFCKMEPEMMSTATEKRHLL